MQAESRTVNGSEYVIALYIRLSQEDRDLSLRLDKVESNSIEIFAGDMTERLPFAAETFDIIINPVSNHYIEKAEPVFRECFRVLKPGGELLCGLDTGIYWAFDFQDESTLRHKLPFNPLENPEQMAYCREQDMGIQFSHTLAEQIGGQMRSGFTLFCWQEGFAGYNQRCSKPVCTTLRWSCFSLTRFI